MGQYKLYITVSMALMFGVNYKKGDYFEIFVGPFTMGIGLTESAKGFGFWKI